MLFNPEGTLSESIKLRIEVTDRPRVKVSRDGLSSPDGSAMSGFVAEASRVSIQCVATGYPTPNIYWGYQSCLPSITEKCENVTHIGVSFNFQVHAGDNRCFHDLERWMSRWSFSSCPRDLGQFQTPFLFFKPHFSSRPCSSRLLEWNLKSYKRLLCF